MAIPGKRRSIVRLTASGEPLCDGDPFLGAAQGKAMEANNGPIRCPMIGPKAGAIALVFFRKVQLLPPTSSCLAEW